MAVFSLRPRAAGEDRLKKATEREKGKKREKNSRLAKKRETFEKQEGKDATRKQLTEERWNLLVVPEVLQGNHKGVFSIAF